MMWKAEDSSYKIDYDPNDPIQRVRNFDERSLIVLEDKWRQGEDAIATHESVWILMESYGLSWIIMLLL